MGMRRIFSSRSRSFDNLRNRPSEPSRTSFSPDFSNLPPGTALEKTNDPSQDFLQEALKYLTKNEKSVIQAWSPTDIRTITQRKYDRARKYKEGWKGKWWLGSKTEYKLLFWLKTFEAIGDGVANVQSGIVRLPWIGLRSLLQAALGAKPALLCDMELALYSTFRLQAYFTYLQHLPSVIETSYLHDTLVAWYTYLLRFLAAAIETHPSSPQTFESSWRTANFEELGAECDMFAARAEAEANCCDSELRAKSRAEALRLREVLDKTLQEFDSIHSSTYPLDIVQVDAALSKLSIAPGAIYNWLSEGEKSLCVGGTRSEILHSVEQWATKQDSKLIFWLCGMAGTGKSTISRTVTAKFDSTGILGASFFFKRGERNRTNAGSFFSTIAAQLTDLLPTMRAPIIAALENDPNLCNRSLQHQFKKLLMQPLLSLEAADLPRHRVAIVIDALDECDRAYDIREILELLGQLEAIVTVHLRIFLTSRPELPVQLGFQRLDASVHQDVLLEKFQKQTIRRDIHAFLGAELTEIKKHSLENTSLKDWPTETDLQALVDLTVPLFIFASTLCNFLAEEEPQTRLKSILQQGYVAGSSPLGNMYQQVLDHLVLYKRVTERRKIIQDFRRVVGPIIVAADPLSVASLARLLRTEPHSINRVLMALASVLDIPSNRNDPVGLLHISFRDFLVDKRRQDQEGFWIDEVETHKTLAYCCLRRLDNDGALQRNICCATKETTHRYDLSLQQIEKHISPDVAYACSYWPFHLLKGQVRLYDNDEVHNFLRKHLLHWLEALSWLGKLSDAATCISDLLSIVQESNSTEVAGFLGYAGRFILRNRRLVNFIPLQIYYAALLSAPTQSIARSTFQAEYAGQSTIAQSITSGWDAEIVQTEGHESSVLAVAFSLHGPFVISALADRTVRVSDVATGTQMRKFGAQNSLVNAACISPNAEVVVTASPDRTVQVGIIATGVIIHWLEEHAGSVLAVALSQEANIVITASSDQTIQLWEAVSGRQVRKLEGHERAVNAVALSSDELVLVSASSDRTVRLWDLLTGSQIRVLEGHNSSVNAVAFSPDGNTIASASDDRTVRLWSIPMGVETQVLTGHNDAVKAVAFSPDGRTVASTSADKTVRLWSTATGVQTQVLEGHNSSVSTVSFSPDGLSIASASDDSTVRLWDVQVGTARNMRTEHGTIALDNRNAVSNEGPQRDFTFSESILTRGTTSFHDSGLGSSLGSNRHPKAVGQDAAETMSIQSTQSTVRLEKDVRASLVDDFVDRLASETRRHLMSDTELGKMPGLLRDFAIIVKKSAESDIQREAAKFIRGQRSDISDNFRKLVKTLLPLQPSHEVTSEERMKRLFFSTTTVLPDDPESKSQAQGMPAIEHHIQQDWTSQNLEQAFDTEPQDENFGVNLFSEYLPTEYNSQQQQIEDARHFLINSTEFQWLSERIRILSSRICTGTTYDTVRSTIALQIDRLVSDSALTLSLDWDPLRFLQDQYPQQGRYLAKSIVFCGRAEASYACTVEDYLQYLWPNIGRETILTFQRACDNANLSDTANIAGATFSITLKLDCTHISLFGHAQSILEIAEVSIWLATACRAYDTFHCAAYCEPKLGIAPTSDGLADKIEMTPIFQPLSNNQLNAEGFCWLNMVYNPVIAQGYPTPARDEDSQKGLEVPFDLLVALSRASWATTFNERFLLKGFLSALVPIQENDSAVVWHLLVSEDPNCRMTYNLACYAPSIPIVPKLDIASLLHRRHFVGIWTSSAKVLAGSADQNLYKIYQSQSQPIDHSTLTWTELTLSGGKGINFGGTFVLGRKDTSLTVAKADDLEFQLEIVEQMRVLFYSDNDRRAWLLDGASALLHLTMAWLADKKLHEPLSLFQFGQEVGGRPHTKGTLLRNRSLQIFAKAESSRLEITQSQDLSQGSDKPMSDSAYFSESNYSNTQMKQEQKVTSPEWTFEGLVIHFLRVMEAMFDKLAVKDAAGPQLALKQPSFFPVLQGWEAKDIILHRTSKGKYYLCRFHLRSIELKENARDWLKLVEEIGAIVLLAESFGDLIRPVVEDNICNRTSLLPRDHDFLAVPIYAFPIDERSLRRITDHSRGCVKLTDYTYWHSFEPVLRECRCATGQECRVVSKLGHRAKEATESRGLHPVNVFEKYCDGAATIGSFQDVQNSKFQVITATQQSRGKWRQRLNRIIEQRQSSGTKR